MLSGDRIHLAVRTKKRNKLPFLQKPPFFISPNVVGTGISLNYPLTLSMSRFVPVNLVSQFFIESLVLRSHREDTSTKIASRIQSHRDKKQIRRISRRAGTIINSLRRDCIVAVGGIGNLGH